MYHKLQKILSLCIVSPEIIKPLWNFILIFSWSRIRQRRKFCFATDVGAASTHSNTPQIHVKPSVSPSSPPLDGNSLLGHPSFEVVRRVISTNNLPCSSEVNKETVCDACQQAKSHQLLYSVSTSKSSAPLELIFFRCVWSCH
jgi:hypothetical protein